MEATNNSYGVSVNTWIKFDYFSGAKPVTVLSIVDAEHTGAPLQITSCCQSQKNDKFL